MEAKIGCFGLVLSIFFTNNVMAMDKEKRTSSFSKKESDEFRNREYASEKAALGIGPLPRSTSVAQQRRERYAQEKPSRDVLQQQISALETKNKK